jgi:hypothetical protein
VLPWWWRTALNGGAKAGASWNFDGMIWSLVDVVEVMAD